MRNGLRILALAVLPIAVAVPICMHAVTFYNQCIVQEKALVATWKQSQLEYDNLWKSVSEAAGITDAYRGAFQDMFMGGMQLRYPGSTDDALYRFLREHNPSLDARIYERIVGMVEAGRDAFTATQAAVNEQQRDYDISLSTFPDSLFAAALGFPRAAEGEYAPRRDNDGDGKITVLDYRIVSSTRSAETFERAREDEALQAFDP